MNISVKNVDEKTFHKLKAIAVESGKTVGEALTASMELWSSKNKAILDGIDSIVEKARGDKDVIAVIIFGSYARSEKNYRDIDVSLLLRSNVREHSKKAAEYWPSDIFDVSILNELPLYVASRVLEEGKVIYVSDSNALEDFAISIVKRWSDFKPLFDALVGLD